MKIALAQYNYHIGNFTSNKEKIIAGIEKAKAEGADLIVFSELCVCGYPPLDLLEHKSFIDTCTRVVVEIAATCKGIAAIVGAPSINTENKGKNLFNSAYFLEDGKIKKVVHKTLLPTYDVFDEYRYFEPNNAFGSIEYKGERFALTICEDLWYDQPALTEFAKTKLYNVSPLKQVLHENPEYVINISASPFSYRQAELKKQVFVNNARTQNLPVIYVNQVGAQTELIFDGASMVINDQAEIVHKCKGFQEDFFIVDTKDISRMQAEPRINEQEHTIAHIHDALVLGIRDYFGKMGFKNACIGLSGGIDSAVTLVLAVKALGNENVRVMLLPSKYSSDHSLTDAVKLAENLQVQYDIVNIQEAVDAHNDALKDIFEGLEEGVAEENIQARVRGTLLMALSNKFGNILLNTSNKSEAAVGYGTLYGDMNGGLSVLGDVYKSDVFNLARFMNRNSEVIPKNIITKPPSAELRPDQKDTDTLPDYDVLDEILYQFIEQKESESNIIQMRHAPDVVKWVVKRVNQNEYKRFQTPPILRVSSKAFGMGRRIPLVASFEGL